MAEVEAPAVVPETPPAADPPAAPAEDAAPVAQSVEELPAWAQKELRKARGDAASNRAKATEQEQALATTRDAIAKALGLKGDDDPVTAAKTAAEQRDAAAAEARTLRVENSVLRMARKHGADSEALTDSRSFMRALEALDPSDAEFTAKLDDAITTALEQNPSLRSAPAPAAPPRSGGPVGGGAPIPGQWGSDDLKGKTPAEINKAREDGLLDNLLGIRK